MKRCKRHGLPGITRLYRGFSAGFLMLCLSACAASQDVAKFREEARSLASNAGFTSLSLEGDGMRIAAFAKDGPGQDLVVYIEGDGRSFINRHTPSTDPTPGDQLVLRLASLDPAPKILYLARPCQFTLEENPGCSQPLWTNARYGIMAVAVMNKALDQGKTALGATRLHLVGYSGGGAMAVLLAARRRDVADILTVGANLDTAAWTAHHGISPLSGSLNPADSAQAVAHIPQTHVSGANDAIVPPALCNRFISRMAQPSKASCLKIGGMDHNHGLEERWADILAQHRANAGWVK